MTLPATIDPAAVSLASEIAAAAVDGSHYSPCDDDTRAWLIERCVGMMMDAGVFVRGGQLVIPST